MKRIINLILLAFVSLNSLAVSSYNEKDVKRLRAEMLRLISTAEREKFYEVSNKLKDVCQKIGDERTFYTAWGNQADYESTRQNYAKADEIAEQIARYAAEQNSHWGNYIALHTRAMTALQKQDYNAAEEAFKRAVDFRHKYF